MKLAPDADIPAPHILKSVLENISTDSEFKFNGIMASAIEKDLEKKRKLDEGRSADFARLAAEEQQRMTKKKDNVPATTKPLSVERLGYKAITIKNQTVLQNIQKQFSIQVAAAETAFAQLDTDKPTKEAFEEILAKFKVAQTEYEAEIVSQSAEFDKQLEDTSLKAEDYHSLSKNSSIVMKQFTTSNAKKLELVSKANECRDVVKQADRAMKLLEARQLKEKEKQGMSTNLDSYDTKVGNELLAFYRSDEGKNAEPNTRIAWTVETSRLFDTDTDGSLACATLYPAERVKPTTDKILEMEYVKDQMAFLKAAMRSKSCSGKTKAYATMPFVKASAMSTVNKLLANIDPKIAPLEADSHLQEVLLQRLRHYRRHQVTSRTDDNMTCFVVTHIDLSPQDMSTRDMSGDHKTCLLRSHT